MKRVLLLTSLVLAVGCASKKSEDTAAKTPAPLPPASSTASFMGGQAHVKLAAAKGSKIKGTVHLSQENDGLHFVFDVSGLKKGLHGVHIHENGDCSAADFSSAGGHFNPLHTEHGDIGATPHHAGDLGNLKASKKGKYKEIIILKDVSLADVTGKSIVIHEKADDKKSQPAGDSGKRMACGVIEAAL